MLTLLMLLMLYRLDIISGRCVPVWLGGSGPGTPPPASGVDPGGRNHPLGRLLPGLPPRLALFGASFPSI